MQEKPLVGYHFIGYEVQNSGRKKKKVSSFLGVNRVYNFGAKSQFSKKFSEFAHSDTKVFYRYTNDTYKVLAR